jgi:acid-sensing ion channel, other
MAKIKLLIPDNLTIHGVSYIADVKSSKLTKVFWIFVMILSLVCFIFCAIKLCLGYIEPDIGIKINDIKSNTLPFPAITICPTTKFKSNGYNYTELFLNACSGDFTYSNENEQKFFEMAMQICPETKPSLSVLLHFKLFNNFTKLSGDEIIDMLESTAISRHSFYEYDSKTLSYNTIFTEEGICYSFNFEDYPNVFKEGLLHDDFDRFK